MSRRLNRCLNVDDLRRLARQRAHRMVFDYIDGGADDEKTLRRNCSAFDDYQLLFNVLAGVDRIDTSTTLLGSRIEVPFFAAPAAGNRLFHQDGETGVALAAHEVGTIYSLSTLSSVSIEQIAALTSSPKWFQLYIWKDRALVREMLARARESGYAALILTVDFPITGNRERDPRNGFAIPPKIGLKQVLHAVQRPAWTWDYLTGPAIRYANLSASTPAMSLSKFVAEQLHAGFDWDDAQWLLSEWNGPAVIKGVVRADDAKRAVESGFNAVMVSNHGGRQLDGSPAPLEVLESVVDAVGADAEVILDGGVRRGTDVLKALALGAKAVSFARPYLYGLAAAGAAGAKHAMSLMAASVKRDMALLGVRSVNEINGSHVGRYPDLQQHGAHRAKTAGLPPGLAE